jgi:DNA-directed RNA polymerase specialized sigma subunit
MAGVHFVKNADLRAEIIKSKENGELTRTAIDMMILMSNKFAGNFIYFYEQDREDCIAVAIMNCYQYWRGYDPEKSQNAFAYFTQIIKNGMSKSWGISHKIPISKQVSISRHRIYSI